MSNLKTKSEQEKANTKRQQELLKLAKDYSIWPAGRNPTFVGRFGTYEPHEWAEQRRILGLPV